MFLIHFPLMLSESMSVRVDLLCPRATLLVNWY